MVPAVVCLLVCALACALGGPVPPHTSVDARLISIEGTLSKLLNKVNAIDSRLKTFSLQQGSGWHTIFDFEHGLAGWTQNGTAFNNQPTYGDNPTARHKGQPSHHVGNWWIGGYEDRPSPSHPAGRIQGDGPTGTLTSPSFVITGSVLKFLIGGGCNIQGERAELVVDGVVVVKATGKCTETMETKNWDVSQFQGQTAQLRLVDANTGGWGHINFDNLEMNACA